MAVEWQRAGEADQPDEAASPTDEELRGAGGRHRPPQWFRRVPRAIWVLLALICVAGAVVVLVVDTHTRSRQAAPVATTPAAPSTRAALTDDEAALVLVRHLALLPGPLDVYIRASGVRGACPLVEPGTSPQQRIGAQLHRTLPSFVVSDVGFVLDPFSALCVLQVRARDGAGNVMVVNVTAPQPGRATTHTKLSFGSVSDGVSTTEYVFAIAPDGWRVTLGCVGNAGEVPSTKDLRDLAEDPAMRW